MRASTLHHPNVSESHTAALHPQMPGAHPLLLSAPPVPTASASRGPVLPGRPPNPGTPGSSLDPSVTLWVSASAWLPSTLSKLLSAPPAPTASASRGSVLPGRPPPNPSTPGSSLDPSVILWVSASAWLPSTLSKSPGRLRMRSCGQPCELAPLPPPSSLDCMQRAGFLLLTVWPSYPAVIATWRGGSLVRMRERTAVYSWAQGQSFPSSPGKPGSLEGVSSPGGLW